jgi:phosphoribosylformylglycinamidine cyclo-ligase
MDERYLLRGVSAGKEDVHNAIKNLDKGLFPSAFCKILPDVVAGDPNYCNIMHADTAGTKTSLAYLIWRETGNLDVWRDIATDALIMNIDDMACVGCVDNIIVSSTIGRNKNLIPGEVISAIIQSLQDTSDLLSKYNINLHLAGGETADVGDIVRTIDVGYTTFARMRRDNLIVNNISPGQVIVGFASYGQARYESKYNSGIGSNGLTSARHDVLSNYYALKYSESYNNLIPQELAYSGSRRLDDSFEGYSVAELLQSPTRTYLPLIKTILSECDPKNINGIIHCSGGGQTKVLHYVHNVHIIKDNLLPIPPVFKLIQSESNAIDQEMFKVFNMGQRLEIYTDQNTALNLIQIAKSYEIEAQIIGRVEYADHNKLTINHQGALIHY